MKKLLIIIILFQVNLLIAQEALFVSAENGLIVRSEPNKKSNRVGKLEFAEKITFFQSTKRYDEIIDNGVIIKGEWYHINANDKNSKAIEGYVFNAFLTTEVLEKELNYYEFKPKSNLDFKLASFGISNIYKLGTFKIVSGYYEPKDGKIIMPDTENDYGHRLLMINTADKIIYQSQGFGEVYSFQPHFYKNNKSGKIIIICQLAFEYCFGGEVFIFENGKIKHIGMLDIEHPSEEKCLIDIININEIANELIFSFKSDNLILEPGSEDILIKNKRVTYNYLNGELILKK